MIFQGEKELWETCWVVHILTCTPQASFPEGKEGRNISGLLLLRRERESYSFIRLVVAAAAAGSFLSFIRDVTDEKEKGGETHKQPFYFLTCYGIRKGFR
jgi:hypothetical protein